MEIAIAAATSLAVCLGYLGYIWLDQQAYNRSNLAGAWFTRSLSARRRTILEKYFSFYLHLPEQSRRIFEFRLAKFIAMKKFVPRQMNQVTEEMKVLISAAAIQLTFGFPRVFLRYFKYILVYPEAFVSSNSNQLHKGEVNPSAKAIVLSWKDFVAGYTEVEGVNLGLHEMAHALQLENVILNREHHFLDSELVNEWEQLASGEMARINEGSSTFFRRYGGTNTHEFFAVAVENFFERPGAFSEYHPQLYHCLCRLLRQDPLLLYEAL